jgi:hypothetical protein
MYGCGKEYVGDAGMADGPAAFKAFCHSLIPLHGDKLEGRVAVPHPDLGEITKELLSDNSKADCGTDAKARINSMLHCSLDDLGTPQPGSVYSLKSPTLASLFPDSGTMIGPLLSRGKQTEDEFKKHVATIAGEVIPVAIEASPACDHVQGKLIVSRLIGGYLVKVENRNKLKTPPPQSVWELKPLWIQVNGEAAAYALIVNCLLVSSCTLEALTRETAMFRVRSQAFADLQVRFGSHAARPGMLLLR